MNEAARFLLLLLYQSTFVLKLNECNRREQLHRGKTAIGVCGTCLDLKRTAATKKRNKQRQRNARRRNVFASERWPVERASARTRRSPVEADASTSLSLPLFWEQISFWFTRALRALIDTATGLVDCQPRGNFLVILSLLWHFIIYHSQSSAIDTISIDMKILPLTLIKRELPTNAKNQKELR